MDQQGNEGNVKSFLKWLGSFFEEPSGNTSHRKITTFSFVTLFWVMIILTYRSDNPEVFHDLQWALTFSGAVGMSSLRILEKRLNRK